MRVAVLGSGSRGNSILIEGGGVRILVDAGFSGKDLIGRLDRVGCDAGSIGAIVLTHEHSDHVRGAGIFARRFGIPIHLTDGTRTACDSLFRGDEDFRPYRAGHPFRIGGLRIDPFLTVHDAAEPVAVAVEEVDSGLRVGVATDLGRPTVGVRHALSGCHLLVLEANHDERMLLEGPYPWSVKERIRSSHGHLSNQDAARLAGELLHPDLFAVVLAHLSVDCNRAELAEALVGEALLAGGFTGFVTVASQEDPTPMLDLQALRTRSGPGAGLLPPGILP